MLNIERLLGRYTLVPSEVDGEIYDETQEYRSTRNRLRSNSCLAVFVVILSLICLAVGFTSGAHLKSFIAIDTSLGFTAESVCNRPRYRREWRSLSHQEKHRYIQAVQCLKQIPSRLGQNQSLYDDFPYVHFRVGGYCTFFAILDCSYPLMRGLDSSRRGSVPCMASLFPLYLSSSLTGRMPLHGRAHVRRIELIERHPSRLILSQIATGIGP